MVTLVCAVAPCKDLFSAVILTIKLTALVLPLSILFITYVISPSSSILLAGTFTVEKVDKSVLSWLSVLYETS